MSLPKAVLAEDHLLIQEAMRLELRREVEVVATVQDGAAALEAVAQYQPDVLLLDVSLPKVNGIAVAQRAKQSWPDLKILFVTAQSDRTYVEEAFRSGASGYLLKGAIGSELREAVREVLAGRLYRSAVLA
ncbi:MAG TPA: response regulator transcription factor [Bryobacteraceae bacterium]